MAMAFAINSLARELRGNTDAAGAIGNARGSLVGPARDN
jgi:hypothetical protein